MSSMRAHPSSLTHTPLLLGATHRSLDWFQHLPIRARASNPWPRSKSSSSSSRSRARISHSPPPYALSPPPSSRVGPVTLLVFASGMGVLLESARWSSAVTDRFLAVCISSFIFTHPVKLHKWSYIYIHGITKLSLGSFYVCTAQTLSRRTGFVGPGV
jgi:hypothetical protein